MTSACVAVGDDTKLSAFVKAEVYLAFHPQESRNQIDNPRAEWAEWDGQDFTPTLS